MPRNNSSKADPAVKPAAVTVPVTTFEVDKKTYLVDGGANKHGRFLKFVEVINGRKNTLFMDHEKWPEIRDVIDAVAGRVGELSLPEVPAAAPA